MSVHNCHMLRTMVSSLRDMQHASQAELNTQGAAYSLTIGYSMHTRRGPSLLDLVYYST